MRLSKIEQETVINFNQEETTAYVYTHAPKLQRKLDKLLLERNDITLESGTSGSKGARTYLVGKNWVKVAPPRRVSGEQRSAAAERMTKMRKRPTINSDLNNEY